MTPPILLISGQLFVSYRIKLLLMALVSDWPALEDWEDHSLHGKRNVLMKGEMSEIVVTIQPMWDDNKNEEILSLWRLLSPSKFQVLQLSGMIPLMTFLKGFFFVFCFFFCCAGSSLLHRLFSSCGEWRLLSSCGVQASYCSGFSCCQVQTVGHTGFSSCGTWAQELWFPGSIAVAQGLGCSMACGIFPDQGSNLCLLHWQVDSFTT